MKIKYIDEDEPLMLVHGKVYDVIEIDEISGWYRIIDESCEDYLHEPEQFEIIDE